MTEKKQNPSPKSAMRRHPDQWVPAADAMQHIRPGRRVFIGTGCAMPQYLVREMVGQASSRVETELLHILTLGPTPYIDAGKDSPFTINSLLLTDNVRAAVRGGRGQYSPISFSDLPGLLHSGELPIEAALIQVSPPDADGLMSLGISVDVTRAAVENARLVIAQVNTKMPRTSGNSLIHVHDVDFLVAHDEDLVAYDPGGAPPEAEAIGRRLAALVDNGATISVGVGRLVSAVLPYLRDKRELGIHTELLTENLLDLIECGAATGARKRLDVRKAVTSFAMGSAAYYERLNEDSRISFQPTEYVNDPTIIARHRRMTSIGSATQIDLTGQVCADAVGSEFYSGVGGSMDFNRGAARSRRGKPIVVMSATARQGAFSRIVSRLPAGAGATTPRADVHYVITEFGTAFLHGKSIQERALSLIGLAHPRYREQLLDEAIDTGYVQPRIASRGTRVIIAPRASSSSVLLADGTIVTIRAVLATDEAKFRRFVTEHCRHALFDGQESEDAIFVDHRGSETVLATVPAPDGEDIVAIAGYQRHNDGTDARAACVVHPDWREEELVPAILQHLAAAARNHDIDRLHLPHPFEAGPAARAALETTGLVVETDTPNADQPGGVSIKLT